MHLESTSLVFISGHINMYVAPWAVHRPDGEIALHVHEPLSWHLHSFNPLSFYNRAHAIYNL